MANSKMGAPGGVEDFILVNLSNAVSKCIAAPFELVKLLLQNQGEFVRGGHLSRPYTGVINCAVRTIREDGILALWRGILIQIVQPWVGAVINPILSPSLKRLNYDRNRSYWLWFASSMATGALAGGIAMAFTYQFDYVRTQLACDVSHRFSGAFDVIQKTIATDGFFSIYRSYWVSLFGIVAYRAMYFGLYDAISPLIRRRRGNSFVLSFLVGWGVTLASGWLTYPIDTIRRRMMVSLCGPLPYHGAWECTSEIVAKEGVSALWAGAVPNVARGVIGASVLTLTDAARAKYVAWRFPAPPPPPPQYQYEEQQTQ